MKKINLKNISIIIGVFIMLLCILFFLSPTYSVDSNSTTNKLTYETRISDLEKKIDIMQKEIDNLTVQLNKLETSQPIQAPPKSVTPNKSNSNVTTPDKSNKSTETTNKDNTPSIKQTAPIVDNNSKSIIPSTKINMKIDQPCGLSADQLDQLLTYVLVEKYKKPTSKLLGQGKALKKMEENYKVNALFAISVGSHETGWGCMGVSKKNNLFGFRGNKGYKSYDSVEDSILAFGRVLRTNYFDRGRISVSSISTRYCPPSSSEWSKNINYMLKFYQKAANTILQK